jgi:diguanylate cyclase (GGDEF)-like protein/PAS domain S-box-containing protein
MFGAKSREPIFMGGGVPGAAWMRLAFGRIAASRSIFKVPGPVRLIIFCAVLLSMLVAAGSGFFVFDLRRRILTESERNLSNIAAVVATQIEQMLATAETVEKDILDNPAGFGILDGEDSRRRLSRLDVHLKLRDRAAGMAFLGSLTIIDAKGRVVNFSRQWPIPDIDTSDRTFFRALQSDPNLTTFMSEPIRNRASGSWVMHLARKISGPNGEFLGVLTAAIELQYLQKLFSEVVFKADSDIDLFRTDGTVLARASGAEAEIGRRFPAATSLKLEPAAERGVGIGAGPIDGKTRVIAARRVGSRPIVVVATKTVAAVLADWKRTATYATLTAVLIVIAIAAMASLFIRLFRNYQALAKLRAEQANAELAQEQRMQFDAALNNMSQGLLMFDASARIVVCNKRYIEMYNLSPDVVKPGLTLIELIRHRRESGSFSGDPVAYCDRIMNQIAAGQLASQSVETADGRVIHILNQPMAAGGWVTTHEDVTEKIRAQELSERQKLQLDAALANMSQGLCMFDAEQRLIVCNKRYADLYELNQEHTRPGTTLREILEHRIASGNAPLDDESYIRNRIEEVTINKPYQITNKLRDGRHIAVVHRPMEGGAWLATHEDVTEAKRREESFQLLFDHNPAPMWVSHRETLRFLAVNDAAVAHYGYSREQFLTMTVADLCRPEDRDRFKDYLRALPEIQLVGNIGRHRTSDGAEIDVIVYSRTLSFAGCPGRLAVIHDITKIKLAEAELQRTKKFLDTVIEHVPMPIIVKEIPGPGADARGCRFALVNRAYEDLMGESRARLIGKTARELYPEERAEIISVSDNEALLSNELIIHREHPVRTFGNGTRIIAARKIAVRDENGTPRYLLSTLDDVTERKRSEERISYLAHNDSLTGLPNRTTFIEHLAATLDRVSESGEQFVVLCLDLDLFKEVNDAYGHLVGDELPREVARRLQTAARGAFLARVGGDEFTLVVAGGLQPAVELGERLLAAFQDFFRIDGQQMKLGLTIGGAVYPDHGVDAKSLLANADAALYQAKAETRGSIRFFDGELAERMRERRNLQRDLRSAIDLGELVLCYQPQRRMSGETVGFEALVRWRCPKRGVVSPADFIPVAEETGLIIPMSEWVLRESCREAASWPCPLTIGVNISPIHFRHGDLPGLVHSVLLETGLAPARLELEITEGVLIDDFSRAVSILNSLKALGVKIAMDDFGTGYSSMSYLHAFPFDKIKIDRAFVRDLEYNRHSMAIVRAIIGLGCSLDVPILAEGVETEAQLAFLAQEGCNEVQGYLTGRPFPIEEYAELIGRQTIIQRRDASAAG